MMNKLAHKMDLARRFAQAGSQFYMDIYIASQLALLKDIWAGEPYMAATYYIPGELLSLFELKALFIERTAGFGAANNIIPNSELLQSRYGLPGVGCSYQSYFHAMLEEGILPGPEGFIASRYACDDAWLYGKSLAAKYGLPFYLIDLIKEEPVKAENYLAEQFEQLYRELSKKYKRGRSISEVVELSNRTIELKNEIDRLRLDYPGVIDSSEGFKLFTLYNDLGKEVAFEAFKELLREIKGKLEGYSQPEVPRILWMGVLPLYKNRIILDIEKRYGCRVVYEELFDYGPYLLSEGNFFKDLAHRVVKDLYFSVEARLNAALDSVERLKIAGIIHFSQRNCRFLPPMLPVMQRRFVEKVVPFVDICGDAIVADGFSEEQCWNRLDVFFEILNRREL